MAVLKEQIETVEVVGLDEAYLDLTGIDRPKAAARRVKAAIQERTGLGCSIGIGPNKLVAKMASDADKPDGFVVLSRDQALERFADASPGLVPGIGPKTVDRLKERGIESLRTLAAMPDTELAEMFGGRLGPHLKRLALFEDERVVETVRVAKSESRETTFERDLRGLAERSGAGLMGKNCVERTATNWHHYARLRRDPALLAFLRRTSVREHPTRMFGTLGDGMWLSRAAVGAYLAVSEHPRCYGELYVPTLLHHLGHRVVDIDALSPLYATVRWEPGFSPSEVDRLCGEGAAFVHPVKDAGARRRALAAAARR
jgi:hypothetical protein